VAESCQVCSGVEAADRVPLSHAEVCRAGAAVRRTSCFRVSILRMSTSAPEGPRRLNLGCGYDHRPGYLNVDFQEFHRPDLKADVRDLSALPDESYEDALALDVLEHLERADVVPTLREWLRVLVPGGSLHARTLDVTGIGRLLAGSDAVAFHHHMMQATYGTQAYPGDYHQAGFTDLTLIDQLFEAGFEKIRIERLHGWLLVADAYRPSGSTASPLAIGLDYGVSPPERNSEREWRWCERTAGILLFARTDGPLHVRLKLELFRPGDETAVELAGSGIRKRATVREAATISWLIALEPGANRFLLVSHGQEIHAPDDPRTLHFQLLGIEQRSREQQLDDQRLILLQRVFGV